MKKIMIILLTLGIMHTQFTTCLSKGRKLILKAVQKGKRIKANAKALHKQKKEKRMRKTITNQIQAKKTSKKPHIYHDERCFIPVQISR